MEFVYTKHQTPRGAQPDAEVGAKLYLLKSASALRLTYQIRMLSHMAQTCGKKLIIQLPKTARVHPCLRTFIRNSDGLVKIERS